MVMVGTGDSIELGFFSVEIKKVKKRKKDPEKELVQLFPIYRIWQNSKEYTCQSCRGINNRFVRSQVTIFTSDIRPVGTGAKHSGAAENQPWRG